MASSLPCIVSYECGCFLDLIKNKNTGWGVDPENEKQLANILHEIDKTGENEFNTETQVLSMTTEIYLNKLLKIMVIKSQPDYESKKLSLVF